MRGYFGLLPPLNFGRRKTTPAWDNVIDFTAQDLDSRVSYSGPAHAYYASNGQILKSASNQWPLEFANGIAVGRHEPEKAATNYVQGVEYGDVGASGAVNHDWLYGGTVPIVGQADIGEAVATTNATGSLTAVYSEVQNAFIAAAADGGSPATWTRIKRQFSSTGAGVMRWYVARLSASDYLYARCAGVPVGQHVASVFRKSTGSGIISSLAQLEDGSLATSPIISATGAQGSRSASSATITDPLATAADVIFSNGSTATLQAVNGVITIPVASLDWSTRYIKQVTLR